MSMEKNKGEMFDSGRSRIKRVANDISVDMHILRIC